MTGGQIKKLILQGISFDVHGDSEGTFHPGGDTIIESESTNNGEIFTTKSVTGVIAGLDIRLFTKEGTLETFDAMVKNCANGNSVSCLIQLADATRWSAVGGAMIIPDGAEEGYNNIRTGATTITIRAVGKEFKRVN